MFDWRQRSALFGHVAALCAALGGCDRADGSGAAPGRTAAPAACAAPASPVPTGAPGPGPSSPPPAGMVEIPAGIFLMGSPSARGNPDEHPPHEAIVAAFYLDKTEVTVAAYMKCAGAGRCEQPRSSRPFCDARGADRAAHPVNCIDLRDADAYCRFAGARLPTEREWEYAARGGSEQRSFSWGEPEPDPGRACFDHSGGSCPVASFAPGAFGLYDMTGNVWEWTASLFAPYPSSAGPDEIVAGRHYVYRGGSWSRRFAKWMRNALRNRDLPEEWSAALGVRCARSIRPPRCPAQTEARGEQCARTDGAPLCEPGYLWDGGRCALVLPDGHGGSAAGVPAPAASAAAGIDPAKLNVPRAGPDATAVGAGIARSRTPQHDADCQQHWPGTQAAYLFTGGTTIYDRAPVLRAAGCRPRDLGQTWTSACCPQ
ncbi:MAG: SUMF1/EgtB/PvdO family nonheme iron enzyme [Deltaproteobacteria bacterium]|nr:SUMF1/EgtB/PvdO family nonheme iron enzyme [Deltaproteobacteria bacterium]